MYMNGITARFSYNYSCINYGWEQAREPNPSSNFITFIIRIIEYIKM
jgi:hypothetical protein